MRSKIFRIFSVPIFCLLWSCVSVKEINEVSHSYVPKVGFSVDDLSGSFSNQPIVVGANTGEPLSKFFFTPFKVYEWDEFRDYEGVVQIQPLSSHTINVQLWKADTLTCEVEVNGELQGDYFEIDRKLKVIGFPFIYFIYQERKTIISTTEEGNLILKQGKMSMGNVFIFSGGTDSYTSGEFKRIY